MNVSAMFSALSTAAVNAKKLYEASKTLKNAELKQMIADLSLEMSDLTQKAAELKQKIVELEDENRTLKSKKDGVKPTVQWGCYKFPGDNNLYCPGCWDSRGKKSLTTRMSSKNRKCSVCQTVLGT